MKQYFVYILTNKSRSTLYVGMTYNLVQRIYQHKHKMVKGFTQKYNVDCLVYFEECFDGYQAASRERQIKRFSRLKKEKLIKSVNPMLEELEI